MSDIKRKPDEASYHHVHQHVCPNCKRPYSCNCSRQPETSALTCIDCERGNYNPMVHGGQGTKSEA